jgi:MFS family permease
MSDMTGPGEYLVSKKYSYFVFSLLFLMYLLDYADRMVVTSLFPFIKEEWGITDAQCGLLVSAVYWTIIVCSFPVSVLIDRWSRKNCIAIMGAFWSLATGACAFAGSFGQLFTTRAMIGIGEAGYAPGGTAMLSALFPAEKRAAAMGVWNISIPLGSAIGIVVGGLIAEHWGWRHAFGLVALPGLVVSLLFFRVRDYKTAALVRTRVAEGRRAPAPMRRVDILREFTRTGSLVFTYFGFAACTFVTTSLMTWLPTYFHRFHDLDMGKAGVKGSAIMLMAMIGAPLGGALADRWMRTRSNARLLFAAVSCAVTGILLFAAFSFTRGGLQYGLLMTAGMTAVGFLPGAAAVTQDVVHPGLRATSYALCVIVQNLLGSGLGPLFVGSLSDSRGLLVALRVLPLFSVVAAVLFYCGSFFYDRDLAKVEKIRLTAET